MVLRHRGNVALYATLEVESVASVRPAQNSYIDVTRYHGNILTEEGCVNKIHHENGLSDVEVS
jgi:hypothetical protein